MITDELRRYASGFAGILGVTTAATTTDVKDALEEIADRIDAEHERAAVGCIHYDQERHYCAVHGDTENGWVRLPVDADGEYIRIGDVMEWCDNGETLTVEGIGNDVLFYIDGENAEWTAARNKRHHVKPDSRERIIEDAQADWVRYHNEGKPSDFDALVERCKRLAGEDA